MPTSTTRIALVPVALVVSQLAFFLPGCGREEPQAIPSGPQTAAAKPVVEPPPSAVPVDDRVLAASIRNLSRSGETFFGGYPTEDGLRAMRDRGVRRVISLKTNAEVEAATGFDEAAVAKELGLELIVIPISAESFGASDVERFAEVYDPAEGPILVHCGSSNTVGGLWAAYLHHRYDLDPEAALAAGWAAGLRSDAMVNATQRLLGPPAP